MIDDRGAHLQNILADCAKSAVKALENSCLEGADGTGPLSASFASKTKLLWDCSHLTSSLSGSGLFYNVSYWKTVFFNVTEHVFTMDLIFVLGFVCCFFLLLFVFCFFSFSGGKLERLISIRQKGFIYL